MSVFELLTDGKFIFAHSALHFHESRRRVQERQDCQIFKKALEYKGIIRIARRFGCGCYGPTHLVNGADGAEMVVDERFYRPPLAVTMCVEASIDFVRSAGN